MIQFRITLADFFASLSERVFDVKNCRNSSVAGCEAIKYNGLRPKLNIVHYNPYSELQGKESSEEKIETYAKFAEESGAFSRVKIIPRVGMDVFASCGMFVK